MNLTQQEYRQLKAIRILNPDTKYIVRGKDLMIWGFSEEPRMVWTIDSPSFCVALRRDILPSLTWESEPLNIDEALEGRGCGYCRTWENPKRIYSEDITVQRGTAEGDIPTTATVIKGGDDTTAGIMLWRNKFPYGYFDIDYCPKCGKLLESEE